MGLEEKPIGKTEASGRENMLVVALIWAMDFQKSVK